MRKDIEELVQKCQIFQQSKYQALKPAGLLQPIPIPDQIWEELTMDFIGGLPKTKGKDTILVVVERLSKAANFIPLCHPYSAKNVAEDFITEVETTWISQLHNFRQRQSVHELILERIIQDQDGRNKAEI